MNYKTLEDPYLTSDQALFEISTQKEVVTQGILKSMKEASIDCNLHNPVGSKNVGFNTQSIDTCKIRL